MIKVVASQTYSYIIIISLFTAMQVVVLEAI